MNILKFTFGWISWHIRAGFWYLGLAFRLYFAVGLDSGKSHPGKDDASELFRCPIPRTYRQFGAKSPEHT